MGNREALLLAAKKCLLEKGYNRTTARDIASAAGVSLAAIGYHFSSKDALLTEALLLAFGEWDQELQQALQAIVPPDVSPAERFEATWAKVIASFETHRPLWIANFEIFTQMVSQPATREFLASHLHTARTGLAAMFLNQEESTISDHTVADDRHIPPCASLRVDSSVAYRSRERTLGQGPYRSLAPHGGRLPAIQENVPAQTET